MNFECHVVCRLFDRIMHQYFNYDNRSVLLCAFSPQGNVFFLALSY